MRSSSLGWTNRPTLPVRQPVVVPPPDPHVARLRRCNAAMALVHACLAVATVASTRDMNLRAPVFRTVIQVNYTADHAANLEAARRFNASSLDDLFGISVEALPEGLPIAWLTVWFFVLTSLAHAGSAYVYPTLYYGLLARKCNPLRWIEYAVTASLMWLVLAQAFAFVSVNALSLSTAMIAVTMASGAQCEFVARPKPDEDAWTLPLRARLAFLLPGLVLYGTASVMLCLALLFGVRGTLPGFVVPTVLVQLALFESFALVLIWQQCQPPSRWILGEYAYQALSLCSKAVLGIVLIVNVLVYEDYACVVDDTLC